MISLRVHPVFVFVYSPANIPVLHLVLRNDHCAEKCIFCSVHTTTRHTTTMCTQQESIHRIISHFLRCTSFNFIKVVQWVRHISPRLHFKYIFVLCTTTRTRDYPPPNHPPILAVHVFQSLSMSKIQRMLGKNLVTEDDATPQSVGNKRDVTLLIYPVRILLYMCPRIVHVLMYICQHATTAQRWCWSLGPCDATRATIFDTCW